MICLRELINDNNLELAQYYIDNFNKFTISLLRCDISQLKIPNDNTFFQCIYDKNISYCTMPEIDLTKYIFDNVNISHTYFPDNSKLPLDILFFQKIKNKNLIGTRLPIANYEDYVFDNVYIKNCTFAEGSILPKDKNFFKKTYNKSIEGAYIPSGDYSKHFFENINLKNVVFNKNSLLPEHYTFLEELNEIQNCKFPTKTIENIHLFKIKNRDIKLLSLKNDISIEQKYLIKKLNSMQL